MKNTYVFIKYQYGICEGAEIYSDIEEAKNAFEGYTGVSYEEFLESENYFELEIEDFSNTNIIKAEDKQQNDDCKIIKEIADYIIKTTQKESQGFQYIVDYSEIQEKFALKIEEAINDLIIAELNNREEVADVELDTDGFDVVLYTEFAPNYNKESEEE